MNMLRAFASVLLLAGCSPVGSGTPTQPPLAGARIGGPFALTDQDGRQVSDRDFAGKWRIMYFGYTFCPDVCPSDLQMLGAGLRNFERADPARAATVVPVFVTVDPARDTPAVLKPYVAAFHPRMVGLTGTPAAIDAVAKEYAVAHSLGPKQPDGSYLVMHSNQAYLMDPDGKPVAALPSEGPPQAVADDLAKWVK